MPHIKPGEKASLTIRNVYPQDIKEGHITTFLRELGMPKKEPIFVNSRNLSRSYD